MGHVNNAVYSTYLEEARIGFIGGIGDVAPPDRSLGTDAPAQPARPDGRRRKRRLGGGLDAFILARVEIDFRSELSAGEEVEVRTRCSRIGTKSFELTHQVSADGRVVADAKSVLVGYDYARGRSVPLSEELKLKLSA